MKKRIKYVLMFILGGIFVFSIGMQMRQRTFYREGQSTYEEAKMIAGIMPQDDLEKRLNEGQVIDSELKKNAENNEVLLDNKKEDESSENNIKHIHTEFPLDMNLVPLKEINTDVMGWILIPDTPISYPVVHGDDNSYYLKHTWDRERNNVGSIFMEMRNNDRLEDFNTIIYGHRMRDNSMFGALKYYVDQDFWEKHPYIYILDETGGHTYEIYAAYEVSVDDGTYKISFEDEKEKQDYIDQGLKKSVIKTQVVPTTKDQILTLSTCTANRRSNRWVVQGVIRCE